MMGNIVMLQSKLAAKLVTELVTKLVISASSCENQSGMQPVCCVMLAGIMVQAHSPVQVYKKLLGRHYDEEDTVVKKTL